MATPLKAVSHAPEDIHILGGESLVYRVASNAGVEMPLVSIKSAGSLKSYQFDEVDQSADYARRVVSGSYGAILDHPSGEIKVSSSVSSMGFSGNSLTTKINIFDSVDDATVIQVTDQSGLYNAINTISGGSDTHYVISLASGTYDLTLATQDGLSNEGVLISFEPDNGDLGQVVLTGVVQSVVKCYLSWRSIRFSGQGGDVAYNVKDNTVQLFRNCKFESASTALASSNLSSVRLEACHSSGCDAGFIGADVLRSCSAAALTRVFAIDCAVVDGCIATYAPAELADSQTFISFSRDFTGGVCVTNNTLVDQGSVIFLSCQSDLKSSLVVGNVCSGSAKTMVSLQGVYDSCFIHNTFNSTNVSGNGIDVAGGCNNLRVLNNWVYPLTKTAFKMTQFNSVWSNNATQSNIKFKDTLTSVPSPFLNNYMFLKKRTPMRSEGVETPLMFSQDAKIRPGMIGALPHTSDSDLSAVHKSVYERPFFGFSGPAPSLN